MKSSFRSLSSKVIHLGCSLTLASLLLARSAAAQSPMTASDYAANAWNSAAIMQESRQTLPNGQILLVRGEKIRRVGHKTFAEGNVSLEVGGLHIECQSLEYDPDSGIAKARTECIFFWGENYACADSIDFDTNSHIAIMHHVAGRGNDLSTGTRQVEEPMFFWADELIWTPEKLVMNKAIITTCDLVPQDWHYRLESEKIEVYPHDHLDAHNTAINLGDTRLVTLPLVTLSLDKKRGSLQDFLPTVGYNGEFGAFVRVKFPFQFDKSNFGKFHVDLYSRSGLAFGFEDVFTLGSKGGGNIYYYRQGGNSTNGQGRLDFHTNVGYQLDKYTNLGFSYGQNQVDLPGIFSPLNVQTSVALTRNEPGTSFQLSSNYSRSGDNTNTGYLAYLEKDLSERTTALLSVDYALASTLNARTQRYHYLGDIIHRGDWYDAEAVFEESQGQSTFFLNREPEVRFRTHPFYVGNVPFVAAATYGIVTESPSNIRTDRGDIRLFIPDQSIEVGDKGRFQGGAGFEELWYGTRDAERVVTARASLMENLSSNSLARIDLNVQLPSGTTPFQSDVLYSYESITAGFEFYNTGQFRASAYGGYDLLHHQAHDFVGRLDYEVAPGWTVSTGSNYDPVGSRFRSVDAQFSFQLNPNIYLTYWTVYDFTLSKQSYQDFLIKFSEHDWDASLAYRGVQNEFFLQFALRAFPKPDIKVGPNTSDAILPQNLPNAFVR